MSRALQRLRGFWFESRLRWILLALLAAAIVGGVWLIEHTWDGEQLSVFPIQVTDKEPVLTRPTGGESPSLYISGVSSDGRWVFLHGIAGSRWLFDVDQRRFVGEMRTPPQPTPYGGALMLQGDWTPDSLLFFQYGPGGSPFRSLLDRLRGYYVSGQDFDISFYELNVPARRSRFLFTQEVGSKGTVDAYGIRANANRSTLAYTLYGAPSATLVIHSLETGRRYDIAGSVFGMSAHAALQLWNWLPDNRTLVAAKWNQVTSVARTPQYTVEKVYLYDARDRKVRREVPIAERFTQLRQQGVLAQGEDRMRHFDLLSVIDQKRIRFVELAVKTSVWELDLDTGNLTRPMDLNRDILIPNYAPSGTSVLTSPASSLAGTPGPAPAPASAPGTAHVSAGLTVHTIGEPPRPLPFRVLVPAPIPGLEVFPGAEANIRFLDDNTLIHTGAGDALWRFDLRTSQTELLWRPKESGVKKK